MAGLVFRAGNANVPEFVVMLAPYMEELLRLRQANSELRFATYTASPTIDALIADTPFTIRQDDDGRWGCSFRLSDDFNSGVSGLKTPEEALRSALNHVATLWETREREVKELYESD